MTDRILSLCSGYGGLDLAVEHLTSAVTVAHVEYESAPSAVLAARWPGVPNLGDLTTIDWTTVRDTLRPTVFTAGYPCQPFSHAGRRKGTTDERHLWPHIAEGIRAVRPRLVLLENVAGHRTLGLDTVLGDLAEIGGYDVRWTSLRAADVGAPHGRERLFIAAADTQGQAVGLQPGLRPSRSPGVGRGRPDHHAAPAAADTSSVGWREGRPESAGVVGGLDAAVGGTPAVADTDGVRRECIGRQFTVGRDADRRHRANRDGSPGEHPAWGRYGSAIARWAAVLGRPAPAPTEPGPKGGQRLSPRFVEWMMGLPDGWVTGVPGLTRNQQLKMLGNGVVWQQAYTAGTIIL